MSTHEEIFCEVFEKDLLVNNRKTTPITYHTFVIHVKNHTHYGMRHTCMHQRNSQAVPCSRVEVVLYMREGKSMLIDSCFLQSGVETQTSLLLTVVLF